MWGVVTRIITRNKRPVQGFNVNNMLPLRHVLGILACTTLLVCAFLGTAGADESPDALLRTTAAGVPLQVIRVNLADPRVYVTPQVAAGFPGTDEAFEAMVRRLHPTIAVDGAYFSRSSLAPIGDIVIHGRVVHEGMMGTALALTADNRAEIRRVRRGHAEDWSGYESVLACGPALVLDGSVDVRATEEGFHDPHVMGSCARVGVGITEDRKLLIVRTLSPVSFQRWGQAMEALGCSDAMNLDAGASTAMYYRGKTLVSASRRLTNVLAVYVDGRPRSAIAGPRRRGHREGLLRRLLQRGREVLDHP